MSLSLLVGVTFYEYTKPCVEISLSNLWKWESSHDTICNHKEQHINLIIKQKL